MTAVTAPRRFGDVRVGQALPVLERTPTRLTLFLFGVAYWTSHRIHYDVELARAEGFDDVLVTANLISAYAATLVTDWGGPGSRLRRLEERNVAPAVAGDILRITGRVTALEPAEPGEHSEPGGLVHCDLTVTTAEDRTIVTGRAVVDLPGVTIDREGSR